MIAVTTRSGLEARIAPYKESGKTVGLVPTMGALHQGHLSLILKALEQTSLVVVSIFVNPTQFNDQKDLQKYPRNTTQDMEMLKPVLKENDLVFLPGEQEMYPEPDTRVFDFKKLDKIMEGRHRPGHFNGVAQVVGKLFEYVKPDVAYFGQKDLQQLIIIKRLTEILNLSVRVVDCPIIREYDGLAMSSRNALLGPNERIEAVKIHEALKNAADHSGERTVPETINATREFINKSPYLKLEYFEIVDGVHLEAVRDWKDAIEIYGCIAVKAGSVRLIDNIRFP